MSRVDALLPQGRRRRLDDGAGLRAQSAESDAIVAGLLEAAQLSHPGGVMVAGIPLLGQRGHEDRVAAPLLDRSDLAADRFAHAEDEIPASLRPRDYVVVLTFRDQLRRPFVVQA